MGANGYAIADALNMAVAKGVIIDWWENDITIDDAAFLAALKEAGFVLVPHDAAHEVLKGMP